MKSIKEALQQYLEGSPLSAGLKAGVMESRWNSVAKDILPPEVFRRVQFVSYSEEVIRVRVEGSAYAHELSWYREKLATGLKVKSIVIVQ